MGREGRKEINCNLCGSSRKSALYRLFNSPLVKCKDCGLVYRSMRLSDRDEIERYTRDTSAGRSEESEFPGMRIKLFKEGLNRIKKEQPMGRLLDIGCGYGMFLNIAKKEGYEVSGIEISPFCCSEIKQKLGIDVFCGTLKNARFPDGHFDVITMWDVLDQVPDPLGELTEVSRVLKKGGFLLVRVRNAIFHILAYPFFKKITVFHLYSFSPSTIADMLKRSGFSKIEVINSKLTFYGNATVLPISIFLEFISFASCKKSLLSPSINIFARKT